MNTNFKILDTQPNLPNPYPFCFLQMAEMQAGEQPPKQILLGIIPENQSVESASAAIQGITKFTAPSSDVWDETHRMRIAGNVLPVFTVTAKTLVALG